MSEQEVRCEGCSVANLHPVMARVVHAGSKGRMVTVTSQGVRQEKCDTSPSSRGVIIHVEFECEHCNMVTQHTYEFIKGATVFSKSKTERIDEIETIWRD